MTDLLMRSSKSDAKRKSSSLVLMPPPLLDTPSNSSRARESRESRESREGAAAARAPAAPATGVPSRCQRMESDTTPPALEDSRRAAAFFIDRAEISAPEEELVFEVSAMALRPVRLSLRIATTASRCRGDHGRDPRHVSGIVEYWST
jgi:hypothetical protein